VVDDHGSEAMSRAIREAAGYGQPAEPEDTNVEAAPKRRNPDFGAGARQSVAPEPDMSDLMRHARWGISIRGQGVR
jgi:hypothetical protein